MEKTSLPLRKTQRVVVTRKQTTTPAKAVRDSLPVPLLTVLIESYIIKGDIECHSQSTLTNRRYRLGRVLWLVEKRKWKEVGFKELQQFFLYLNHGHEEGVGRWDNHLEKEPLKPGSIKSFHASIRAFLRWCVKEGELDVNPLDKINTPVDRPDQIQPFTEKEITALLASARKTLNPRRDEAILLVLLDCGLRVSELCALNIADADFSRGEIRVTEGKGGKMRSVPFGRSCKRALWHYLQTERRFADPTEPLFLSDRGPDAGVHHLTRRGIQLLLTRLANKAKIDGVRVSPHTFRHTAAIMLLRNGANVFAVKALLGHESLAMTNRYVAIAQADLVAVHRTASPADKIKASK